MTSDRCHLDTSDISQFGAVYGWPEEISGKIVRRGAQNMVAPLISCTMYHISKNDLSVITRAHKALTEKLALPHKLIVIGATIDPAALQVSFLFLKFLQIHDENFVWSIHTFGC